MRGLFTYGKNIFLINKRLLLFLLATLALLLSGSLVNNNVNLEQIFVIITAGFCGVVLFYDVGWIDYKSSLSVQFKQFLSYERKVFYSIVLLLLIPYALTVLPPLSFFTFAITAFLAFMYSHPIKINDQIIRLKNIFLVKNLMIGFAWGALVLIGAGSMEDRTAVWLTLFAMVQVFVGSMIRDVSDVNVDPERGIRSIPVVLGIEPSINLMHLINGASFGIAIFSEWSFNLMILFGIIVGWRAITLMMLKGNIHSPFWVQTANLMTCCLFFFILLIQHLYGIDSWS